MKNRVIRSFGSSDCAGENLSGVAKVNVAKPITRLCLTLAAVIGATAILSASGADSASNADGKGAYATGKYRNLFAEAGHSQTEIRQKIDSAFQQLFHGDPATQTVYYEAGTNANGPLAFTTDIKHRDVRSEGLSYGMIIAVQLNKKAEFDAIWNWSKTYLYVSETNHPSYGFFAWQARTNGVRMSQFVAPDGEEYYVTALYFAAHRWGNGTGIYNYKEQADELLTRMRHRPKITGPVPCPARRQAGWWSPPDRCFDEEHKMVLFSPSSERARIPTPPIILPAFYELWSRWGPKEDAEFWKQAADVSRDYFVKVTHPVTGVESVLRKFRRFTRPAIGQLQHQLQLRRFPHRGQLVGGLVVVGQGSPAT